MSWFFRRRQSNQVRDHSLAQNQSQTLHDSSKKYTSEAPLESPPSFIHSEAGKESGLDVFGRNSLQGVESRSYAGKYREEPVVISEEKVTMVRKRLASL